jgi:putative molybdenum carrier protein
MNSSRCEEFWSVDVPWACFGIVAEDGVVVEVAPIAGWAVGKKLEEVLDYFRRRDAVLFLVWRKEGGKVVQRDESWPFTIVSGGQTGADRGGLDAALELGVPHHGWCPRGRRAEDGIIPAQYQLIECKEEGYSLRTELNVADSHGTIIFTCGPLNGGSYKTWEFAEKQGKPYLWIDLTIPGDYTTNILTFIAQYSIRVLNVAGNRESKSPGIHLRVHDVMLKVLVRLM